MSLTGSCFSSESARPSIMGFEDEVEQSNGRPCRNERQVQATKRTHLIHRPRGTSFHRTWSGEHKQHERQSKYHPLRVDKNGLNATGRAFREIDRKVTVAVSEGLGGSRWHRPRKLRYKGLYQSVRKLRRYCVMHRPRGRFQECSDGCCVLVREIVKKGPKHRKRIERPIRRLAIA